MEEIQCEEKTNFLQNTIDLQIASKEKEEVLLMNVREVDLENLEITDREKSGVDLERDMEDLGRHLEIDVDPDQEVQSLETLIHPWTLVILGTSETINDETLNLPELSLKFLKKDLKKLQSYRRNPLPKNQIATNQTLQVMTKCTLQDLPSSWKNLPPNLRKWHQRR